MDDNFPKKKTVRFPHGINLKVDDQTHADMEVASAAGYDVPENMRIALAEHFAKLKKKIGRERTQAS